MIEREAIPKAAREDTVAEFCVKWGIANSTYYLNASSKENLEKIDDICFRLAKKHTPEVLENLGERAKENARDAELYLEYVSERKKRFDMTSGDKPIPLYNPNAFSDNNSIKEDTHTEETA